MLVVAGGVTADGFTASTEIFEDGEWREVGELPMAMSDLRGVTLEDTVIMTGGDNNCPQYEKHKIHDRREGR